MKTYYTVTFLLAAYFTLNGSTLASTKISDSANEIDISKDVLIAKASRQFAIEKYLDLKFEVNKKKTLALGYNNDQSILLFEIENLESKQLEKFLYFNSINGYLNLYEFKNNLPILISVSGTDIPYKLRPHSGIFGAMPIKLGPKETKKFLLTIMSRHNLNGNLIISNEESLARTENNKIEFLNFYAGGIILLAIYNLFIYLFLREKTYLLYCFYAISFTLSSLTITGKLDQIVRFSNFTLSHYLICFSSISIFAANFFTYRFLEVEKYLPKMKKVFSFFSIISIFLFFSGFIPEIDRHPKTYGLMIDATIFLGLLTFNFVAIKTYKQNKIAFFYLLAWFFVLMALTVWFGMTFGILKVNSFTQNALPIGNMMEMLILSLALAYKIQILNNEKFAALEKAKDKEKYERLVRVLSHDVANSLTIINSYAKKLSLSSHLEFSDKNRADKIYANSENIKNILEIVREQEKLMNKNKAMELYKVNLYNAIHISKNIFEEVAQNKNITFKISIPENLMIMADKTCLINNILNNIISNSIKFSFDNSHIEIQTTESEDFITLHVRDFGTGIKESLIEDIFHSNKTISTEGTKNEVGNGFGTNLIREYMTLFGGKIQVTSISHETGNINHGTTVKLIFPRES